MGLDVAVVNSIGQDRVENLIPALEARASRNSPTISGNITLTDGGVRFVDGVQTGEGVVSRTPIVRKTKSYTLSGLTERDSLIEMNSTLPVTVTIPTDQSLNFPVGTSIDILQANTGQVSVLTTGITTGTFASGGAATSVNFNLATTNYDVEVGQLVSGTGIAPGTLVVGVNGPSIVMDTPAASQISGTITFSVGLVYTPGNKLRTKWSSATLFKRSRNSWILYGDITA